MAEEDGLSCRWGKGCDEPAFHGVSVSGARHVPACWEHALFQAVPLASIQTVELAPLDWAFDDPARD